MKNAKTPKPHPNKDIEEAINYAIKKNWTYISSGKSSHSWGRLLCPWDDRTGCMMSIWSTPRNAFFHAKRIMRAVDLCPHKKKEC